MRAVCVILVGACSSTTPPPNEAGVDGAPDVAMESATTEAAVDAASSVPEVLDQSGKLVLWLEATPSSITLDDAGGVTTWKDASQHHNDALGFGPLPVLESAIVSTHDAVWFDATSAALRIADAPSLQLGTGTFVIVAVTRVRTFRMFWFEKIQSFDGGTFMGIELFDINGGSADGGFINPPLGLLDNLGDSVSTSANLADGAFHVLQFRRTATTIEIAVDDAAPQSQAVSAIDVSAAGQPLFIGSPPQSPGGPPNLEIAEQLVVRDTTDADVASVHAYLKQKYAL